MGAVVAFEFARIAEAHGAAVQKLWASAGPAPCVVAGMPELPTSDDGVLADIADLGGTDPELLADEEFAELLATAVRADYQAFNRYHRAPTSAFGADIHVLGGTRRPPRRCRRHCGCGRATPRGRSTLSLYDGGHFYVNDHIDAVAAQVNADV